MNIELSMEQALRSLAGGALIGLSAAILLVVRGEVAGISGVLGRLLRLDTGAGRWRLAFVVGLIASAVVAAVTGVAGPLEVQGGWPVAIVAGLLTGVGTGLASGCTSGHGVCGLSNLSMRSLVATLCFMGAGFVTVFVTRHLIALVGN